MSIEELQAENARLKADFSQMTAWGRGLESDLSRARVELMLAKAQVERLTERLGGVRLIVTEEMYDELNTKYLEQQHELQNIALTARQILDEKIDLKAQVERLTKAGDAMVEDLLNEFGRKEMLKYEPYQNWNAAKEGKGQP